MNWHPHAASYALLEGDEYEAFKQDISANGQQETVKYRTVSGKKQGLDGRNRERACLDLGIECRYEKVFVDDDKVNAYIDSRNLHRRHLTRDQRQAIVQMLRADGQSVRQIAEKLGVGSSTVQRDIADSKSSAGVPNGTPENNKRSTTSTTPASDQLTVTGRDGKSYLANKQAGLGSDSEIPERLRSIFDSVPLFKRAVRLCERVANLVQEIEKTPAYQKAVEGKKHVREHSTYIRAAGSAIKSMMPERPCPKCGGEYERSLDNDSCEVCMDRGYQTADEVDQ